MHRSTQLPIPRNSIVSKRNGVTWYMFVIHEGYARLCCVFALRIPTLSAAHTQGATPDEWNEYKMEETADGETGRVPVGNACKRHGQAYARCFQAICSFEMLCSQYHSDPITKAAFDEADQHLQAGKFQEVLAEAVIDERQFKIKKYIHDVGMRMQRSLRKTLKQVNKNIIDIVDAIDFNFLGQDVIVDGLRYVISKEMELKDPERPGNTRK
jgi:hypothetical protein